MLRRTLLTLAASERTKNLVTSTPVTSAIVARYVPGETTEDVVEQVADLVSDGRTATLDYLGEDTTDEKQASDTVAAYLEVLESLQNHGLSDRVEVSVKLSAVGQALPDGGEQTALENARAICRAADAAGTTVTLDMEDHTTTDSTLRVLRELRRQFPQTGGVVQSYLRRTEQDCRELAAEGARVRLCKGAYHEPEQVAYQSKLEVDRSYVRCLNILMNGSGYPMVASHDPRMVEMATALARRAGRANDDFEFQMLFGIRPAEQQRLVSEGYRMRVYVPYGHEWYGYLMRRLAERPSNLRFFLRSLVSSG